MAIKAETGIAAGRELQVKDLYYSYGEKAILQGLDFRVAAGELCVLLGANGAGKSTLVKCISGLLRPQRGKIFWKNRDMAGLRLKERAKIFGYVPQNTHTGDGLTVMETVLSGRFPHFQGGLHQKSGSKDLEKAAELLKEFGLEEFSFRSVKLLSGGERQRVLIARAVAQEPQVLLLDEPTSNLDLRYQVEVMRLIRRLSRERGLAVIAIIHDLNLALDYGDRAVVLKQGKIAAEGKPGKTVTAQVISDAYQIPVEIFDVGGRQMVAPLVF